MTPEEIQADYIHMLQDLGLQAAADYHRGVIDFGTFQEILAGLWLAADDTDPTPELIAAKIAEMDTAAAFISAGQARPE